MNLVKGLMHYQQDTMFHAWALDIELQAANVLKLIHEQDSNPSEEALVEARNFLVEVEKWKAGCLQQRMENAERNTGTDIWRALRDASIATNDLETLSSIMRLKGFGSSRDEETGQRRAKVATSVLRFLWPEKWGVVDWRVAAIIGFLEKNRWDVDESLRDARSHRANEFRELYDLIDEHMAIAYVSKFRKMSSQRALELPRAADVDMALFGISLLAWPMPQIGRTN